MTGRDRAAERGAATVLVVAMASVVLLTGAAVAAGVGLFAAHRQAQAAADVASLAGAGALQRGRDACGAAADLAAGNGARLTDCRVLGADVRVRTAVPAPGGVPWPVDLVGSARAGPDG